MQLRKVKPEEVEAGKLYLFEGKDRILFQNAYRQVPTGAIGFWLSGYPYSKFLPADCCDEIWEVASS